MGKQAGKARGRGRAKHEGAPAKKGEKTKIYGEKKKKETDGVIILYNLASVMN